MATRTAASDVKVNKDATGAFAVGITELVYTDTVLAGAATFTSAYVTTGSFNRVTLAYTANVSGTAYIDFSQDGTNVLNTVTVAAGVTGVIDTPVYAKFARVRLVNGATIQTSFFLAMHGRNA